MHNHDEEFPSLPEIDRAESNVKFYVGTVDFDDGNGFQVVVYLESRALAVCLSAESARSMANALMMSADRVQPSLIDLDEP